MFMPVKGTDDANVSAKPKVAKEQLSELKIKLVKNYGIPEKQLSYHRLHLNQPEKVRLVKNFISCVNKM